MVPEKAVLQIFVAIVNAIVNEDTYGFEHTLHQTGFLEHLLLGDLILAEKQNQVDLCH